LLGLARVGLTRAQRQDNLFYGSRHNFQALGALDFRQDIATLSEWEISLEPRVIQFCLLMCSKLLYSSLYYALFSSLSIKSKLEYNMTRSIGLSKPDYTREGGTRRGLSIPKAHQIGFPIGIWPPHGGHALRKTQNFINVCTLVLAYVQSLLIFQIIILIEEFHLGVYNVYINFEISR